MQNAVGFYFPRRAVSSTFRLVLGPAQGQKVVRRFFLRVGCDDALQGSVNCGGCVPHLQNKDFLSVPVTLCVLSRA